MTASKCEISRCGLCRFYTHEGRRGGICSQLDAPVGARWKACCLADSPFESDLSKGAAKITASTGKASAADCAPRKIADYSLMTYSSALLNRAPVSAVSAKAIAPSKVTPSKATPAQIGLASKRAQNEAAEDLL